MIINNGCFKTPDMVIFLSRMKNCGKLFCVTKINFFTRKMFKYVINVVLDW
jgi:hypothetical protein